ncbi:MAG: response regulator transcription factor [Flavobacteriaceae bacterium]|nr:response regulator transcription factor [Flavobacteriaceae bacterium]
MKKLSVFIVEDIPEALEMLSNDIKKYFKDLEVIGTAKSVVSASKQLKTLKPDIIFLDIMLGDGTGFDILEIVPEINAKTIFITANDEYAIKAFKFSATDYILKPYSLEDLSISIQKAIEQIQITSHQIEFLKENIKNTYHNQSKIFLHTTNKVNIVDISTIIYCKADNNYTTFHLNSGSKIVTSKTLKHYSILLISLGFMRTHQSYLVNKSYIKEYIKSDGGYLLLKNNVTIPISTRKKNNILAELKKN